jgi:hypothetical protein
MPEITSMKPVERTVEIVQPADKSPIGLRLFMMGLDDDRMTTVKRSIMNERLNNERRGKTWKAEDIETNKNRVAFAAITGWEWYDPTPEDKRGEGYKEDPLVFHGEKPTFTQKNFYAVLTELPWISSQIDSELGDTEAFFSPSKPS